MRLAITTLSACLLAGTPAAAITGAELEKMCADKDVCVAYVTGVNEGMIAESLLKFIEDGKRCYPDGVTIGQATRVVEKYLADNPDMLHIEASAIVAFAMVDAFPCPE